MKSDISIVQVLMKVHFACSFNAKYEQHIIVKSLATSTNV